MSGHQEIGDESHSAHETTGDAGQEGSTGSEDTEAPRPRTRFRRPRRSVLFAAGGLVLATALVVTGIGVTNAIAKAEKAKAEAVEDYQTALERHDSTFRAHQESTSDARAESLSVGADDLDNAALLTLLKESLERAEKEEADLAAAQLDTSAVSREEVEAATAELDEREKALDRGSDRVDLAVEAVESDKTAKEERLAAEKQAAEAAAAKAAAVAIGYEDLFRAGNAAAGSYYKFEGKIIQDAGGTYRVNITREPGYSRDFWEDTILVTIAGSTPQRLLEDDIIAFTALSAGVQSYTTIFGATVELPSVVASGSDVSVTGRAE